MIQLPFPGIPAPIDPLVKRCARCLTIKPVSAFSRDRSQPDGLSRNCRQCDSNRHKQRRRQSGDLLRVRERRRYSANPDHKRKTAAEYRRSDRGKALNRLAVARYRGRNAEKYAAHLAVRKAIAAGILPKPVSCELAHLGDCSGRVEYHHDDYRKPLGVRSLCVAHHNAQHRKPNDYAAPAPLFDCASALGGDEIQILEAAE
jgi:hypothetical protein